MLPSSSMDKAVQMAEGRRRRPPPKLRTKTGCLTCKYPFKYPCRQRRKKCNEQRPICDGCSRNKLACLWKTNKSAACPESPLGSARESSSPCSPVSDTSSAVLNQGLDSLKIGATQQDRSLSLTFPRISCQEIFGVKSRNESHLLHHFLFYSLPTLIGVHAHPVYQDHSLYLLSTMDDNPVKDALFALSSLHLSNRCPEYGTQALRYYSESVHHLRERVENSPIDGLEDHLIMTVVWLYLFEIWQMRQGIPCRAGYHLKACMRILQLRKSSLAFTQRGLPTPWERIIAESVLFNSATMALFDSDIASISIDNLRDTLEPFLSGPAIAGSSPFENSPVLGISSEVFFIALEVSQLCYKVPLGPVDYIQALHLRERIKYAELQYLDGTDNVPEHGTAPKAHQAAELYITASKALLFKILHPKTPFNSIISTRLSSAMDIIRDDIGETFCGQYFTWPAFVISCALDQENYAGRDLVRQAMKKIWNKASSGNVIFVLQALDTISEKISKGVQLGTLELMRCCVETG